MPFSTRWVYYHLCCERDLESGTKFSMNVPQKSWYDLLFGKPFCVVLGLKTVSCWISLIAEDRA